MKKILFSAMAFIVFAGVGFTNNRKGEETTKKEATTKNTAEKEDIYCEFEINGDKYTCWICDIEEVKEVIKQMPVNK